MIAKQILRTTLCVCMSALSLTGVAATGPEPAKVMMFGVFHFANPGLDKVKSSVTDVMTPQNQTYLDGLSSRIAAWHPTDVLVECDPADQAAFDSKFATYQNGAALPSSNELLSLNLQVQHPESVRVEQWTNTISI